MNDLHVLISKEEPSLLLAQSQTPGFYKQPFIVRFTANTLLRTNFKLSLLQHNEDEI